MSAGIAQENGNLQNITFSVGPGETFVVPQGLLHYNHNQQCEPNIFFQSFDSADPGALNVIGALAAFNNAGASWQARRVPSHWTKPAWHAVAMGPLVLPATASWVSLRSSWPFSASTDVSSAFRVQNVLQIHAVRCMVK